MRKRLERAVRLVRDADTTVAFTGAGVSTASGIPDFRSPGGVWDRYDPGDFHVRRFETDPAGFWRDRAALVADVHDGHEPNAAHEALAALEREGELDRVVTQNIDGLHARAGSESVVELHGDVDRVVCHDCGSRHDAAPFYARVREGAVDGTPRCPDCSGLVKPDVVLFGESLPTDPFEEAKRLAHEADCFLVVGSSLTVEPAASLPDHAAATGSALVVVNLDETPVSDRAEVDLRADATDVLPEIRTLVLD